MPGRIVAIEKLGTAPIPRYPDSPPPHTPDTPGVVVAHQKIIIYKIMLSEPAVVKMLCDSEENKNNESIQKLADMTGNDVEFNWKATNENIDEVLDSFKKHPSFVLGAMIASRSKKVDNMCTMCKNDEEDYDLGLVNGCYKVPGKQDMGCANCAVGDDLRETARAEMRSRLSKIKPTTSLRKMRR